MQVKQEEPDIPVAYMHLLHNPDLKVEGLSSELKRTEEETEDLLQRMQELSLIHPPSLTGGLLLATHPMLAMQQLIAREQLVMEERRKRLEEGFQVLTSVIPQFATRAQDPEPMPNTERLVGLVQVRQRLEELAVRACFEVASFTPPPVKSAEARAAARPLDAAVLQRGVGLRTLYSDSILMEANSLEYAQALRDAGADVRVSGRLPMRLIVVDAAVAVVPLDPDDAAAGALVVKEPGTVAALLALFEAYWTSALPLDAAAQPAGQVSQLERAILRQLATGAKDEAVARQFGLSVRTLRRGVADLMDRLDARSRFELGVKASARGWLEAAGGTRSREAGSQNPEMN